MGFKSHIGKKKKTGSRPGSPGSPEFRVDPSGRPGFGLAVATAGLLLNPDRSSHRVDPPGRAGFNNSDVSITVIRKLEIKVEIRVRTPYNLPNINLYQKKIDLISAIMSNRFQIS
jgi:hypothetical protein